MTVPDRHLLYSLGRGAMGRCPACGKGRLFRSYLKVADHCTSCGEALHHHRADDAPAYFTLFIVGHLVVPLLITLEIWYEPPLWAHMLIAPALSAAMSLVLLPVIKGTVVGWQWALRMHGFHPESHEHHDAEALDHGRASG